MLEHEGRTELDDEPAPQSRGPVHRLPRPTRPEHRGGHDDGARAPREPCGTGASIGGVALAAAALREDGDDPSRAQRGARGRQGAAATVGVAHRDLA